MPPIEDTAQAFIEIFDTPIRAASDGPLAGLTFAAKDNIDVAGRVTGNGSPLWRSLHQPAEAHAPVVTRLLKAGASLVGKTHMDEFAFSLMGTNAHYGTPLNSAAPSHVPGGSSSGSAAAVAAGLVDFALGTDTGGSVRLPSSFCGLFGMRPSHGAIDMHGVVPLSPGLDTLGWLARDASGLALVGRTLGVEGGGNFTTAWLPSDLWAGIDPQLAALLKPQAHAIAARFDAIVMDPLPIVDAAVRTETFRLWQGRDAWKTLGSWIETQKADFGPDIAARFAGARAVTEDAFASADSTRRNIASEMERALAGDVLMIIPTSPGAAPRKDSSRDEFEAFRRQAIGILSVAGLASLPQISMPAGSLDGAPVGLSLVARRGGDGQLLSFIENL